MTILQDSRQLIRPEVGQTFNPYKRFTGIFVPDGLLAFKSISPGAKLAYGRLARYAGQDGNCFVSVPRLARELGLGTRQVQKYLAELETERLLRRRRQFSGKRQMSNSIDFLWHRMFEAG